MIAVFGVFACLGLGVLVQVVLDLFRLDKEGHYYTYSALGQSLASLLGVLGIFGVYRLQVQHQRLSDMYRQLREFYTQIPDWKKRAWELADEELLEHAKGGNLFLATKIIREEKRRERIKEKFLPVAALLATSTVASLILIGRGKNIEGVSCARIPLFIFGATLMAIVFTFWFAHDCLAEKSFAKKFKRWARNQGL